MVVSIMIKYIILLFCLGRVIQEIADKHGFSSIRAMAGHGIGAYFHGPPDIYHFRKIEFKHFI